MPLEGVVQNGMVKLDRVDALPDGTRVTVAPTGAADPKGAGLWDDLVELADEIEKQPCDLPDDLAANHDHYLYGTPKRS